jgi:hypothetical protein
MSKQERDQRQVLATNLELLWGLKVLAMINIVRRIKKSRTRGLAHIAALIGYDRVLRGLLEFWPADKGDAASLMQQFILNGVEPTIKKMLEHVSDENLAKLFERWLPEEVEVEHRLTFEQIANNFDMDELWACVRHGLEAVGLLPPEAPADGEVIVEDLGEDTDGSPATEPTDSPDGK